MYIMASSRVAGIIESLGGSSRVITAGNLDFTIDETGLLYFSTSDNETSAREVNGFGFESADFTGIGSTEQNTITRSLNFRISLNNAFQVLGASDQQPKQFVGEGGTYHIFLNWDSLKQFYKVTYIITSVSGSEPERIAAIEIQYSPSF